MADKKFNITFDVDANIGPVKNAVSNLQSALNKINIPDSFKKGLTDTFTKLDNEIKNFESIASKGFTNLADVNKAEKSFDRVTDLLSKLRTETARLKGVDPNKLLPKETIDKTKALHSEWVKLKAQMDKGFGNTAEIAKQNQELDKQNNKLSELQNKYNDLAAANKTMGARRGTLSQSIDADTKKTEELVAKMQELEKVKGGNRTAEYKQLSGQLEVLNGSIKRNQTEYDNLGKKINENKTTMASYTTQISSTEDTISQITATIEQLKSVAQQTPEGLNQLREKLAEIKGVNLDEIPTDIDAIGREIQNLNTDQVRQLAQSIDGLELPLKETTSATQDLSDAVATASGQMHEMTEREKEIEQLANRVKYFFSIGNTVQLFKRAVKSAINTVKELDEVMTQAAVVTQFDVSGMWAQLPEYTKRANELGVTVKGVYEASTLYYQQGLETEQVIGVTNETLKMAKIAGLDYATATDYMTSALRGFNMEVNELSAQKVNDIYSQLAAKTASNVEEISIAMSKVAPLAHNAGMEIETTAAMLAQMIEKTREAPETLGTAMKTVIARFQELKKDPALIEPVDGEMVDANKVETALNTIGVALRDTSGQFRQLDEVFLEISQKWNSLDVNTQRYIATIAAGSRQQSRFIAMMADYARTTDLVNLANNAAGASAEQFEKTQASLATALKRLQNAWDQFAMGLSNNQVIKKAIDLITDFINIINKAINTLSGGNGLVKSILNLGALLGGIKLARAAFNGFFGWLLKTSKVAGFKAGTEAGTSFSASFNKALSSIKKAFTKSTWVGTGNTAQIKQLQSASAALNIELAKENVSVNALNAAYARYNAAMASYVATLTLTNKQQEVANILTEAGVDEIDAKILATSGLTATEAQEFVISQAQLGGEEAEIKARIKNAAAIKAEDAIEKKHLITQQQGILTRAKNIVLLLFGTKETRKKAMADLGMAAADEAATGAQWSLNAAIAACPIGWILAGIAALVAILVVFIKIAQNNSLEKRMERAAELTKEAKEAADSAKQAYEDLLEDKNEYNELQQTLEDLTYGTQEWKEALIAVNQQVLELIKTYPELAKYIQRGIYGQLTINQEGWDNFINNQQEAALNAQGLVIASQIRENKLRKEALTNTLNNTFKYWATVDPDTGISEEIVDFEAKDKITKAINEGLTNFSKDSQFIQDLAATSQLTAEQLSKAAYAMMEYNAAVEENEIQMRKSAEAFLTTTLDSETIEQLGNNFENIINAFEGSVVKNNKKYSAGNIYKVGESEWETNEIFQSLVKDYKLESQMTGNDLKDLQVLYARMAGIDLSSVENMKDKKQLAKNIADIANNKEVRESMNKFANSFLELGEDAQKTISMAFSNGTSYIAGMNKELFEGITLESQITEEKLTEIQEYIQNKLGAEGIAAAEAAGFSLEEITKKYIDSILNGQSEIEKSKTKLTNLKIQLPENFGANLDAGAVKGLTNHLLEVFEASGAEAASSLASTISDITEGLDFDTASKFATIFNGIDWKSADNIEQLSGKIKEMGLNIGLSDLQIDELEQQIISLAKAARTVDLEKLEKQIKELGQIAYDIGSGKQSRNFSEEAKDSLVKKGIAEETDFVFNFETGNFTYLGNSMEALRLAIIENTKALTGDLKGQLQKDFKYGKEAERIFSIMGNKSDKEIAKALIESGLSDKSLDWLETTSESNIKNFVNQARGAVYELPEIEIKMDNIQHSEDIQQYMVEYYNNFSTLGRLAFTDESAADALKMMAYNAGLTDEALEELNYTQIASILQSRRNAQSYEIEAEELDKYAKSLLKTTNAEVDSLDKAYKLAIANKRLEKGYQDLIDNGSKWYETLSSAQSEAEKGSPEYLQAEEDYKKAIQNIINTNTELSTNWVKDNIENLNKAIQGNSEAFDDIVISAIIDTTGIKESEPEIAALMSEILNNYKDVKIGATADIDTSPALAKLLDLLLEAQYTAGQISKIFKGMGWKAQYEIVGYKPSGAPIYGPEVIGFERETDVSSDEFNDHFGGSRIGGSGGGKEAEWENPYDRLYNYLKEINGQLRIREQLEKRYNRLIKLNVETGQSLKENIDNQIASLQEQNRLQKIISDERLKDIKKIQAENSDLNKYARFDETIGVGGEVQIEWDLINEVDEANDEELGKRIEDYISKMEEWADSHHEAIDAIEDNTDAIIELREIGKEEYKDLEDRVLEAIISQQQKIIDEQEKLNDAITDANEALTDAISKNIEKIRQDRQNQETETSLAEKERRLAYLRQDTTGSNAVEIKKLEKDLEKERQNYTDSLIDQSLNDLKEQNDAAAKQREKQIELMQSQLNWQKETGYWVDEATKIVKEGLNSGIIDKSSKMYELLSIEEGLPSMSNASRSKWFEELQETISKAFVFEQTAENGGGIMANMLTVAEAQDFTAFTGLEQQRNEKIRSQGLQDEWPETRMVQNYNNGKQQNIDTENSNYMQDMIDSANSGNWAKVFEYAGMRDKKLNQLNGGNTYESFWEAFDKWHKAGQRWSQYASGGLADYTGPAWLDGTKSRPEMVLNARDTQNFLELRDLLSTMASSGTGNSSVGNFYCDIDINVGEISSDYDVDRIAARIKQSIYEDTTYRNVNAINFLK